jgi:hypothetical protein
MVRARAGRHPICDEAGAAPAVNRDAAFDRNDSHGPSGPPRQGRRALSEKEKGLSTIVESTVSRSFCEPSVIVAFATLASSFCVSEVIS